MHPPTALEHERTATSKVTPPSSLTSISDPNGIEVGVDPLAGALPSALEPSEILRPARSLTAAWMRVVDGLRARRDRMSPLTSRPLAPVVLWAICAGAALAATQIQVRGALAAGVAGALAAITLLHGGLGSRLVIAAAMLPVAFAGSAPSVAWVLAGILVAGVAAASERPLVSRSQDLQRHLDWCRRREEQAHVLVIHLPEAADDDERRVLEAFRLTDSVAITRYEGRRELHAVVDDHRLSREGLQRRVVQEVGPNAQFGWAAFPEDGFTLDVLLDRAASELDGSDERSPAGLGRLAPARQTA